MEKVVYQIVDNYKDTVFHEFDTYEEALEFSRESSFLWDGCYIKTTSVKVGQ